MLIKVNGKTIEIFEGARVMDVLRRYSRAAWKQVQANKKKVTDAHGHEVTLDGELDGGEELFIKACPPEETRS
jgi:sulfur carrier protein ThiS